MAVHRHPEHEVDDLLLLCLDIEARLIQKILGHQETSPLVPVVEGMLCGDAEDGESRPSADILRPVNPVDQIFQGCHVQNAIGAAELPDGVLVDLKYLLNREGLHSSRRSARVM